MALKKDRPKTFVVDRKRWLHGEGSPKSALLRGKDQKMCCLGFLAKSCAIPEKYLLGVQSPKDINDIKQDLFPAWGFISLGKSSEKRDATLIIQMMQMNDRQFDVFGEEISHKRREEELKKLFAEVNVRVVFKGEYPKKAKKKVKK